MQVLTYMEFGILINQIGITPYEFELPPIKDRKNKHIHIKQDGTFSWEDQPQIQSPTM